MLVNVVSMEIQDESSSGTQWQTELTDFINRKKVEVEVLRKLQEQVRTIHYHVTDPEGNSVQKNHDESDSVQKV
jgi:hypothetical protein